MQLTFQDFLKATADIYHPKRKKRLQSEEKRQIAQPYIDFYIEKYKGTEGDHMHNIASQSWHAYKKAISKIK
jgi:hypothetical protein